MEKYFTYFGFSFNKRMTNDIVFLHNYQLVPFFSKIGVTLYSACQEADDHMSNQNINLQKSLVLMYPKANVKYHSYPSILNAIWDFIVTPQLCPSFAKAHVPLIKLSVAKDANSNQDQEDKLRLLAIEEQNSLSGVSIFDDDKTFITVYQINSYTTNMMNYQTFHSNGYLSDSIHYLNESILLAKIWKGKVDIKVFPNLCYVAIIFRQFFKEAKDVYDEGTQMIIDELNG